MSPQQLPKNPQRELSFIEAANNILLEKKEVTPFSELLDTIAKQLNLTQDEVRARMVQFYTDLNIDGRFIPLGDNRWGLRSWYPVDQVEDEMTKMKKKKNKATKSNEEEVFEEEEFDFDDEYLDGEVEDEIEDENLDDDDPDSYKDPLDSEDDFEDDEIIDDEEFDLEEREV